MALGKKVLIEYLYDVEYKLVDNVKDKYNEQIKKEEEKIIDLLNIKDTLKEHQQQLNKMYKYQSELAENPLIKKHNVIVNSVYYSSPLNRLYNLTYDTKDNYIMKTLDILNFDENPIIKKLTSDKNAVICDIQANYNRLINVCSSMPSGKKIQTYLEELGFDLSNLKEKEQKPLALITPMDVDRLRLNLLDTIQEQENKNE